MMRQSSYIRYWDRLCTGFLLLYRPWSVADGKEPDQASPPIGVVHVH